MVRVTCIAGLVHDGKVYLGGDSAAARGWDMLVRADPKVFRNGSYVIGFTSSWRMGQLLRYAFDPPEPSNEQRQDLFRFMATVFVDAVRECLKTGGYATKDKEQESSGEFLVGLGGRLFIIYSDYQVAESLDWIAAVGCGAQVALGALYAQRESQAAPHDRVMAALDAAERFSNGVRGPFKVEHV